MMTRDEIANIPALGMGVTPGSEIIARIGKIQIDRLVCVNGWIIVEAGFSFSDFKTLVEKRELYKQAARAIKQMTGSRWTCLSGRAYSVTI